MNRSLVRSGAVALLTLAVAACTVFTPRLAPSSLQTSPAAHASTTAPGSFTSPCPYSHRLSDDPIVFPNLAGAAHSHDFFGNRTTNATSTTLTLLAGATTCRRTGDTAAYWVPSLTKDGAVVAARAMRVYYRTGGLKDTSKIRPFPSGLRVIAGDARARTPQPIRVASWACTLPGGGSEGDEVEVQDVPSTCADQPLRLRIVFPNCWDGRSLDSADHKSHMAYSSRGVCPTTHPVPTPQITMSLRYWITGDLTGVRLVGHGNYSAHADFFNSWKQTELTSLINHCLRGGRACGETGTAA